MGCGSSSQSTGEKGRSNSISYVQIINEKCPHIKMDFPSQIKSFPIKGVNYNYDLSYVYVSQRGFYPNALGKANQDSYVVCENFGNPNCHLFGVFDGHGEYGDYCSHFAADQVPFYLEKGFHASTFEGAEMEQKYTQAFVSANVAMHKAMFDDSLSGTTGVTAFVKGDTLFVANVGDSRAIIARVGDDNKLKSYPLSVDQTPFRKDERERLKKQGAKIMTLDQIEGLEEMHENWGMELGEEIDEVGDPPRVWDATLERPGCAFTRSLGDHVAEMVGVHAVPELMTWKLSKNDKFMVIASDGVFEFLTSQAVVDAIAKFKNPLEAAKHVVSEAYRLWLTYDDRTDDITIIIVLFDNFEEKHGANTKELERSNTRQSSKIGGFESKPVRANMSKAKRKVIAETWNETDASTEEFDFAAHATEKSPEALARISEMTKANFMFQSLSPDQRTKIFQVITLRDVAAGEDIIREGDDGDEMYLIDGGHFDVLRKNEDGMNSVVFTYTTEGAAFGELSLMYGKPRAASVRAKTAGRLWVISRLAFRAVLMKKKSTNLLASLRALPFLESVPITKLQQLSDRSVEETWSDKAEVASKSKQQTLGAADRWVMVLVLQGALKVQMVDASKKGKRRDAGMCFGAVELDGGDNAQAALASGSTKVVRFSEAAFKAVLGYTMSVDILSKASKRPLKHTSIFHDEERIRVNSLQSMSQLSLVQSYNLSVGDYGYIATFANKGSAGQKTSIKTISKSRVSDAHMDGKIVQERNFLAAIRSPFVARLANTFQDSQVVQMIFSDVYECDLAFAMNAGISSANKVLYAACLFAAVRDLHEHGVMHRFLNPSTVYMSATRGVPVLCDLRYAKEMDGSKAFTICGDPLFFAPEIVGQTGYDFGVDYWAMGITLFEMYEESCPFGTADTEETALFQAITAAKPANLVFSNKTPEAAQKLITQLLQTKAVDRIGYSDPAEMAQHGFFEGVVDFSRLKDRTAEPVNSEGAIDSTVQIDSKDMPPSQSALFANF